jgi:hypothetical protein
MKRMKKVATGLVIAMLSASLPATAFAQQTAGKKIKAAIVRWVSARATPTPTIVKPQQQPQQKPSVVVKRVWVGGAPWLGGYESTVVEKVPETRQAQTQPKRVWVGGPPWLGGYETLK